jgi:hypothetical protein
MRFEELAAKAGKAAAHVGTQAERPSFGAILDNHRSRILIAGWSTAAAAVMVVFGVMWLWPGSGSESPSAAAARPTTTLGDGTVPGVIAGGRETCPVTGPGDSPFTPASETPDGPPPLYLSVWYGTPELWTMVQHQGQVWSNLPVGADGSLTQKTFWWSDDYVPSSDILPDITVTADHLNGSAPGVEAGGPGTTGAHADLGSFMLVGLQIPQEGCWRITGEYRGTSLSYVAWVGNE